MLLYCYNIKEVAMLTTIRQIGNSKGIIIPASFLAEAGLQSEVEICLDSHSMRALQD